jgi:archaellum component FlaC
MTTEEKLKELEERIKDLECKYENLKFWINPPVVSTLISWENKQ